MWLNHVKPVNQPDSCHLMSSHVYVMICVGLRFVMFHFSVFDLGSPGFSHMNCSKCSRILCMNRFCKGYHQWFSVQGFMCIITNLLIEEFHWMKPSCCVCLLDGLISALNSLPDGRGIGVPNMRASIDMIDHENTALAKYCSSAVLAQ